MQCSEDLGAAYYERYYRDYAAQNPAYKLDYYGRLVRESAPLVRDGTIRLADLGCAFGDFLASLPSGWERFGVDTNGFAIASAQERHPAVAFRRIQDFTVPVRDLDVVTAFDVLEHIPDVHDALSQIHAALRDDGVLVMVVPVYDGPLGPLVHALDKDPTHVHKRSRAFWRNLISERFSIVRLEGILRWLLPGTGRYIHLPSRAITGFSPALAIVAQKAAHRA